MNPKQRTFCHIISGDLWAGAEVMAFHLLCSLKERDNLNVFVILLNEGRLASEIRKMGLEIHVIDENSNSFINLFLRINKLLKGRSVNIIHTHRYKENLLSFLVSIINRKVKLIATQHGMPEFNGRRFSIHNLMNRLNFSLLSRFFDKVIVVSNEMKKTLENSYGFKSRSLKVIHNGIPVPENTKGRTDATHFYVGSSGRLFPVKDYRLFIEMANMLKSKSKIRFRLAGDGPEYAALVALIKEYQLDGVFEMSGHVDDIDSFYNGLDLFVNTSVHEGIPMSILEAMSHGLPVVAPRIGGLPEIIDNGNEGFLIEGRSPAEFAEKCILLSEDKSLYAKMSNAARARIEKDLSSLKMAEKYYSQYLEIVKN
jgi:L-malate glycosyltransferase